MLLHELPGALHRRRVDDGVEQVRAQARRILPHGALEAFADREDAPVREAGVLADEEPHQVVEVPERVVDRCGSQQQQIAPPPEQEAPQDSRAGRGVGIAVVVRLVDDHELVLVERALERFLGRVWAPHVA